MVKQKKTLNFALSLHSMPACAALFSVLKVEKLRPREVSGMSEAAQHRVRGRQGWAPRPPLRTICPPVAGGVPGKQAGSVPRRDQKSNKISRPGQRSPPWMLVTLPLGGRGREHSDLSPEQPVLSP